MSVDSLRIGALHAGYKNGALKLADVIAEIYQRVAARGEDHVWIHTVPKRDALKQAAALSDPSLPLYGIPFAVKDNVDVAGLPTTAGCPAFRYTARETAPTVQRLLDAGAILIGKTNLDQFATGLVGVRSPYGIARNPFDERYIPGGSSSGSAVAVASGLVSFALGTDTAGSGRVPAAFNNIVGLKPTRGFFSARGVVPACRTLDCVSVFALTCDDAAGVAKIMAAYDPDDPFSRADAAPHHFELPAAAAFRFGVPDRSALEFFGAPDSPHLFEQAIENLKALGGTAVEIDFTPLRDAAGLLYQGPWVAERMAALKSFFESHADDIFPVTRKIIEGAKRYSAVETFEGMYRLAALKRRADKLWDQVEVLLAPTAGMCFTIEQTLAEPVQRNTDLGYYTNFVNLLDQCAIAAPAGFCSNGLPFGVTLIAPAARDGFIAAIADRLHRVIPGQMGATGIAVPSFRAAAGFVVLAVVGAHLRGLPLNRQVVDRGAQFVRQSRTAPIYRLYELAGTTTPKPGLVRAPDGGASIEIELWQMSATSFGEFVNEIPPPLGIGSILLETGETVKGFLCEQAALADAADISSYGGWRRFLSRPPV